MNERTFESIAIDCLGATGIETALMPGRRQHRYVTRTAADLIDLLVWGNRIVLLTPGLAGMDRVNEPILHALVDEALVTVPLAPDDGAGSLEAEIDRIPDSIRKLEGLLNSSITPQGLPSMAARDISEFARTMFDIQHNAQGARSRRYDLYEAIRQELPTGLAGRLGMPSNDHLVWAVAIYPGALSNLEAASDVATHYHPAIVRQILLLGDLKKEAQLRDSALPTIGSLVLEHFSQDRQPGWEAEFAKTLMAMREVVEQRPLPKPKVKSAKEQRRILQSYLLEIAADIGKLRFTGRAKTQLLSTTFVGALIALASENLPGLLVSSVAVALTRLPLPPNLVKGLAKVKALHHFADRGAFEIR